jgi:hypothetical protein
MRSALLPVLAISLLIAGCSSPQSYPSLARRPAERITGSAPAVPPTEIVAAPQSPSPQVVTRLTQLSEQARDAHARFNKQTGETTRLVGAARGAAVASESWSVATVALANLESARSDAMIALAELDSLYAAQSIEGNDTAAIASAREEVIAIVADEDAVLSQLRGRIRS